MTRLIIILVIFALFYSCRKPIASNNKIIASGIVVDTVKNKNLPNAIVLICGCDLTFYGLSCHDSVTSTKTDRDGNFTTNFITNGKYYSYFASVMSMPNNFYIPDYTKNSAAELKVGENKNLRLKGRELDLLKYSIKINDNPYDTLFIYEGYNSFNFYNLHQIDTTLYFKVVPTSKIYIYYYTWDSKVLKERRQIMDSLNIEMADTTYYSRMINKLVIPIE